MKFVKINQNNESEFIKMYKEYVQILHNYDSTISLPPENNARTRLNLPHSKVYFLQYEKNIVGFIILGFGFNNSFSCHDIFIEEFFIKPEYQRKRLGSKAIIALVKKYPKHDFSAFIIENNKVAQEFWETTFARCGYVERTLAGHITAKCDNLLFKYWIKNKEENYD